MKTRDFLGMVGAIVAAEVCFMGRSNQTHAQEQPTPRTEAATPAELGRGIDFSEDYAQALERSRESGMPVLLLFQEVPG